MAKLIGRTYGEALFALAVEEGKEDAFLEESMALRDVLRDNPDLSAVMKNPRISREDKVKMISDIFDGRISEELLGFIQLTIEKDRYSSIDEILAYFIDKMKEYKGIGIAYVQTAVTLSEIQKEQVEKRLLETTKYTSMEMHYDVDEKLIGGMVIRIGDRVIDSSVRSGLNALERDLQKIKLA